MAGRTYAFNALPPVCAKGYADPVPIFEPLDPIRRGWTKRAQNFVAREQELEILERLGQEISMATNAPSKIVFISGPSGIGKTTLSLQAIQIMAKAAQQSNKRLMLTKHMSKGGDTLIPFR
jgi:putative ribosome biogenesis GTPase RsgA